MKKVSVAIIGCGVIAPTHAESFKAIPGVEFLYAVDVIRDRAEHFQEQYGFRKIATDYRSVLKDPELNLVVVCTDHAGHAEIVVAALDAKKHVLCEKPLGISNVQLDAMLAAHRRNPELVFSGIFQHRHEASNRLVRKLVGDGMFGKLLNVNLFMSCLRTDAYYRADAWRGTWAREGGGVLINQTIHHLDLLRFFFGEVESVAALCVNAVHKDSSETEDNAVMALRFRSGLLGCVSASNGSAEHWRNGFILMGTEGYMEYFDESPVRCTFNDPARKTAVEAMFRGAESDPALQSGKAYYGGGHPAQLHDVIDAIREARAPYVSAEEAAGTVRLVCAIYEASRSGRWETIQV